MKPYFAKYLPIEGEIKEGEVFFWKGDSMPIPLTAIEIQKENGVISYDSPGYPEVCEATLTDCKKVKLFLCSRYIQIGDSFLFKLGYGNAQEKWCEFKIESEDETHYHCSTEDAVVTPLGSKQKFHKSCLPINDSNFIVKVIGEISKDALQGVKEGDEFEESDVQFWHGKRERASDTGFVIDPSVRVDWVSWVDFVKIKCPWGHFH